MSRSPGFWSAGANLRNRTSTTPSVAATSASPSSPSSRAVKVATAHVADGKLTHMTDRLIVTANCYEDDSLQQFRSYLTQRFGQTHYKIFNFCWESEFNIDADIDNVTSYPFNAGNPCALTVLLRFCNDVETFLGMHAENAAILHCRTGKSRSCMMAACFLLHAGVCTTALDAVAMVNRLRSADALRVPSMIRYVLYYEKLLRSEEVFCRTFRLTSVRITTVPLFSPSIVNCGCAPWIAASLLARSSANPNGDVQWFPQQIFSHMDHLPMDKIPFFRAPRNAAAKAEAAIDIPLDDFDIRVRGDVCLSVFSGDEKMAQLYFNTCFLERGYLSWGKQQIDIACLDTKTYTYDDSFRIELFLQQVDDVPALNIIESGERTAASVATATAAEYGRTDGATFISGITTDADSITARRIQFMYSFGHTNIDE